jgi:hypothetical protein
MAKSEKKILARELRRQGRSIKSIAKELTVSQGSVSLWCRDILLTTEQLQALEQNFKDPRYGRRLQNSLSQQGVRIEKTKRLYELGKQEIGSLSKRELLLVGSALYWAEGYKKDSQVGLGSSDPKMMQLYVRWLIDCFGYTLDDLMFRVTINESHAYRVKEIVEYWARLFGIDESTFQKSFFQKAQWKKVYEHPEEYFGVLRIRVRKSSDFLRKIHGLIAGLQQTKHEITGTIA